MAHLDDHLAGWDPPVTETTQRLAAGPVAAFAALLDQPPPAAAEGDPLPPLWHWFSFLHQARRSELGEDGHPERGAFLPPIPQRRRMIAGGRLRVYEPMRIGDTVTRRSSLQSSVVKRGRSGEMAFLTVRHEFRRDFRRGGALLAIEEQDVVYRQQAPGARRSAAAPAHDDHGDDPAAGAPWRLDVATDPVLLFRFSALTANAHRIHYDRDYARDVEGFPGLVVHGPLLALLLLELPRRHCPGRRLADVSFRLQAPVFAGQDVAARGLPGSDGAEVHICSGGVTAARGEVRFVTEEGS
jgi:3-methylfumaryl-CoA hydratase